MKVNETGFRGLYLIEPTVFKDHRGYFFEAYNRDLYQKHGLELNFVQDNESKSGANVLRGLHFQLPPWQQGKLVRVMSGAVMDTVVDLRKDEPTYGKHYRARLDAETKNVLYIPPGFAHGFLTLEENTVFFYKCTQFYNKASEDSILWKDPDLNIDWGIENPIVSEKDENAGRFKDFISPF